MWTPRIGAQWPPEHHAPLWAKQREWSAWWEGNTDSLTAQYSNMTARVRPAQLAGGIVGKIARFFWGRPQNQPGGVTRKLHTPVAGDIARTSADLLYSEPPTITASDETAQNMVNQLVEDKLLAALQEGAEMGSALGGRFHRVTMAPTIYGGRPFITTHGPDEVVPQFHYGVLTGAYLIYEYPEPNGHTVYRHLESHWLDERGLGHISHTLWEGTTSELGHYVPLTEHYSTSDLVVTERGESPIPLTPGLAVVYVPNVTPQRAWRKHPVGRYLGRPDIEGLEGKLDSLDEAWSSWMRDIRLGQARLLIAEHLLEQRDGDGSGLLVDTDREVFTTVQMLNNGDGPMVEQIQFDLRVDEHYRTVRAIMDEIVQLAGYSLGSFQESQDTDITATEVKARRARTLATRGRKITHETDAIRALVTKALSWQGHGGVSITVEFPDGVQVNPMDSAVSLSALRGARLMSTEVGVRMLHPDWNDKQVQEEVARIDQDEDSEVTDPTTWHPSHDHTPDSEEQG